jgi:hypothetical protein
MVRSSGGWNWRLKGIIRGPAGGCKGPRGVSLGVFCAKYEQALKIDGYNAPISNCFVCALDCATPLVRKIPRQLDLGP